MASTVVALDTSFSNITIKDGQPIHTRNGLQISKQKYRGNWFVNTVSILDTSSCGFNQRQIRFREPNQSAQRARKFRPRIGPVHKEKLTAPSKSKLSLAAKHTEIEAAATRVAERSPEHHDDIYHYPNVLHRPLTDWSVSGLPSWFSGANNAMLFCYLEIMPKRTYAFEFFGTMTHNPMRDPTIFQALARNQHLLQGAMVIGGVCDSIRRRNQDPILTAFLSAQLCSFVNCTLPDILIDSFRYVVMVQAVATLALLCHLNGQYDQWHIHIKGLRSLVEYAGGLSAIPPYCRNLIYKADIIPSTELAIEPYFGVFRFYPSVLDAVDVKTHAEISSVMERILGPCCKDKRTVKILTTAAIFLRAVFPPWKSLKFMDPDALMEEWWALAHEVLTIPEPIRLRQDNNIKPMSDLILDNYSSEKTISTGRSYGSIIVSVLRLSLILYSKIITPYLVDTPEHHPLLLLLHMQHMRVIWAKLRGDENGNFSYTESPPSEAAASFMSHRATARLMRPVLIWCALIGKLFSERSQGADSAFWQDQSVYQTFIVEMVGSNPADVDNLSENDLEFCQLFDLRAGMRCSWNLKIALKRAIQGESIVRNHF